MNPFKHVADLGQHRVPYSSMPRRDRNRWMLAFNGPDGKRRKLLTLHPADNKTPPAAFHEDAVRSIREVYQPPSLFPDLDARKTWDDFLDEVEKALPQARPETIRGYRSAVKAFKEIMPEATSPLDVSEERVRRFAKLWLAAPPKRGTKPRSPTSLSYILRGLSGFTNHVADLGYMSRTKNFWLSVRPPKAEKRLKVSPSDSQLGHFMAWIAARYPQWKSLRVLLDLKARSGCRTADLCQIKTKQLRDGHLVFAAETTKTREDRAVPLGDDLWRDLTETAGREWLWEGFFADVKKYRRQSNGMPAQFSWKTVMVVVKNIFREYAEAFPDRPRFTPHALRGRAITLVVVAAGGNVDRAARALGVHPQTARAHYLDRVRAFEGDEVMRAADAALRLPRAGGENGGTMVEPKPAEGA